MKTKILLSFVILFLATITTNAQIKEGTYLLGGSVGYNTANNTVNTSKNESLNSNIQFGKFIKDNTAAGVIFSYGFSNLGSSNKTNFYSAGVFYRKYKSLAKGFYFFGELEGVYNYSKNTQGTFEIGNNAQRYTSNGASVSFTPGVSYSIFKKIQMELLMPDIVSISYGRLKTENITPSTTSVSTEKSNNFSARANLNSSLLSSFAIGFKFLLGK